MQEITAIKEVGESKIEVKQISTKEQWGLVIDTEKNTYILLKPHTAGRGIKPTMKVLTGTEKELKDEIARLELKDKSTLSRESST